MTLAAIAEVPRQKKLPAPPAKAAAESLHAMPPVVKPAQWPTQEVPLYLIVRSETNIVREVDDDFVEKIRAGVHSPVLLRPIKATEGHVKAHAESWKPIETPPIAVGQTIFKLVYGERRWEASKRAGHTHIPATIRELTDTQALEIQVSENEDREDYKPMQRAAAYAHLRDQYMKDHAGEKGFTEEKCCDLIAQTCKNAKIKGRTVQQIIALGRLHKFCQDALNQGEMEASHGYELCRRSEEEQLELLKWIRKETQHSLGDVPSVRRLKLEIRNMDIRADEKRRQKKLFQEGEKEEEGSGAKLTFDGKTIELAPGQLPGSVRTPLLRIYPDLSTAHFLKDGRIQLATGLTGAPFYMTVPELQKLLSAKALHLPVAPPQTSAPSKDHGIDNRQPGPAHNTAPRQKIAQMEKQRIEENRAREEKRTRSVEIERQARVLALDAIAKKAKLDRALIDLVAVEMLKNSDDDVAQFAVRMYGFPKPKAKTFSYNEIEKISLARVPDLKPSQLAGLLVAGLLAEDMFVYHGNIRDCKRLEAMARKYKVNMGKIRKDLELRAKGQKPKAKKAGARA